MREGRQDFRGSQGTGAALRWLVPAGLVVFAFGGLTLLYPPGADQSIFLYVGRAIREGGLPYRDAFDIKPPGIYGFYALADLVFGRNLWGARLLELLLLSVAILPLRRVTRAVGAGSPWIAFVAWLALYFAGQTYWDLGQAESVIAVLSVGYLALLAPGLDGRPARRAAVLSGVLLGLALVFKQTTLPLVLAFVAWWLQGRDIPPAERFARLGLHAAGVAVVPLLVALVYAVSGALDDLLLAVVRIPAAYADAPALTTPLGDWARVALIRPVTTALILAGLLAAARGAGGATRDTGADPDRIAARRTLLAWVMGLTLAVAVQRKGWTYHLTLLIPPLALLLALGLAWLGDLIRARRPAWALPAAVLAAVLLVVSFVGLAVDRPRSPVRPDAPANTYAGAWRLSLGYATGSVSREEYYGAFLGPVGHLAPDSALELGRAVREACPEGRSLQLFDFWPAVYLYAEARNEHRFFMITHPIKYGERALLEELFRNLYSDHRADCLVLPSGIFPPNHPLHPARHGYVAAGRRAVGGGTPVTAELYRETR